MAFQSLSTGPNGISLLSNQGEFNIMSITTRFQVFPAPLARSVDAPTDAA